MLSSAWVEYFGNGLIWIFLFHRVILLCRVEILLLVNCRLIKNMISLQMC